MPEDRQNDDVTVFLASICETFGVDSVETVNESQDVLDVGHYVLVVRDT